MSSSPKASKNSSLQVSLLDFSALQMPGNYTIHIGNVPASYPFSISTTALRATAVSSLKGFYYQRVSQPLEFVYAGTWARAVGHPDTAVYIHPSAAKKYRLSGTVISSPGGWYDAGDYNKYIVNSGITMGTLLSAYEDFKIQMMAEYTTHSPTLPLMVWLCPASPHCRVTPCKNPLPPHSISLRCWHNLRVSLKTFLPNSPVLVIHAFKPPPKHGNGRYNIPTSCMTRMR
jgi:hypothetical protein